VTRHQLDVVVVLGNAFVQMADLAEQIADDSVGPAGQVFQVGHGFAAHHGSLEGQDNAQFAEQAANAVERGGALLYKALAGAVHHELALLVD